MYAGNKTFVVYVTIQEYEEMPMYSKKPAQIKVLLFDKASIEVLIKYSNYNNVFLGENAIKLLVHTKINNYAIELEEDKQRFFEPIYSLGLVELKTLKIYIKTNLADSFIKPFKSHSKIFILFDWKPDRSFCLYVNYWGLNNITIKKRYPLSLINESLY